MSTNGTLNGHPGPATICAAKRRAGRRWILIPIGLIATQMSIVIGMMYVATSDPTFAVEPDYYDKALAWDSTAAQLRDNARLAWRADSRLRLGADGGEIEVRLANSDGLALDGASIKAEVFSNLRAGSRKVVELSPRGDGVYAAPVTLERDGYWECRLVIKRGPETFTSSGQVNAVREPAS